MKKGMKFLFIGLSSLSVLGIVGSWGAYSYLRSPSGSRFILSKIQDSVSKNPQTKLNYRAATIDPFSTVHFENLVFTQDTETDHLELKVAMIEMRYSISFLS